VEGKQNILAPADWLRITGLAASVQLAAGPALADEYGGKLEFTHAFVGMCVQDLSGTRKHADFDYFAYRGNEVSYGLHADR
jgi:hypothetical protein